MILPLAAHAISSLVVHAAHLACALDADREIGRYLDVGGALVQVLAASAAATPDMPSEILLALAYRESRYSPTAGPHGHYPVAPVHPPRARVYRCGVVQADASTWRECVALRDPFAGYLAGAAQLGAWAATCRRWRVREVLACSLAGYARGVRAARAGARTHVDDVLLRARRLERATWEIQVQQRA